MSLTKISNNSLSAISSLPAAITTGALTLISTQTASSSASISFTSGIDSTYDSYVFKFINIHCSDATPQFRFQVSTNSGSSYGITLTSTYFITYHDEADTTTGLTYATGSDQAQTTNFKVLGSGHNDDDSGICGTLQIFNPSSTTFVKHFIARSINNPTEYAQDEYMAGYFNTTSAIDAVQFKMASGNIDDGIIKLYGVS